jgi:hypothetical protein
MKFKPSASDYDQEDVEHAMRISRICGGREFLDLQKYLDSCSLHNESEDIFSFLKESHIILGVMSDTSSILHPPYPETAFSTAIRQFKSEVHQRLIYLNRILQMVFYSQATFSVYC